MTTTPIKPTTETATADPAMDSSNRALSSSSNAPTATSPSSTAAADHEKSSGDVLPPDVVEKLQAGAFRSLCEHLRLRSDTVPNLELMTISGFCRNCLAKWMVIEARRLVDNVLETNDRNSTVAEADPAMTESQQYLIQELNGFGYDEAARHVYGMNYNDWKRQHQKKSTEEQMERYNASKPLHAVHNVDLLAPRSPTTSIKRYVAPASASASSSGPSHDDVPTSSKETATAAATAAPALASNVCCQDVDTVDASMSSTAAVNGDDDGDADRSKTVPLIELTNRDPVIATAPLAPAKATARTLQPYQPPPLPTQFVRPVIRIAILTISDRAHSGIYASGDLSGPAVAEAIRAATSNLPPSAVTVETTFAIVPDDVKEIQAKLLAWSMPSSSSEDAVNGTTTALQDIVFTTGGTGLSRRDVTPEATRPMLDQELSGLMAFVMSESSKVQPLATLSRGTVGILRGGRTLVANLPGNPKAVQEVMPILLPLLLHALNDLQS